MSFLPEHADDDVMNEINMTPLIDIMLVLLIVFILAVPALQSAIPLTLPQASSSAALPLAEPVQLDIDAQGRTHWNGQAMSDEALQAQARQAAQRSPQPVVRLRADRSVSYECVLQTLGVLQTAGLSKVNFMAQSP